MPAAHYHVVRPFRIGGARLTVTVTTQRRSQTVDSTDALHVGDQLVYRLNAVSVYRAGTLLGTIAISSLAVTTVERDGWIQRTDAQQTGTSV